MDFIVDFTRITNSVKLNDRFLTVQVKKTSLESKIEKGTILSLVEITKPWFPNSQIGQKIINALVREYQRSSNTSDLVNFELSLKKVNKTLAYITQNGETDWIGNLNAVLAVIHDDSLHLAQAGKAEAYLFRDGKINHITEHNTLEMETHPLKTFSDISSGKLNLHDKILISSTGLFDYFSLEKLRQLMMQNSPQKAALQISKILKKEKNHNVNLIILEIITKDELANRTLDESRETIYLDQKNLESFFEEFEKQALMLTPLAKKLMSQVLAFLNKTGHFIQTKLLPQTKSAWEKTKQFSKAGFNNFKKSTGPALAKITRPIKEKIAPSIASINHPTASEDNSAYNVHHYDKPLAKHLLPYWQKITKFLGYFIKNIMLAIKWLFNKNNRSALYILTVIILTIILILSIGRLREKQLSQNELETLNQTLVEAQDKYNNDVKLAILYNDQEKAKKLLQEISSSIETISDNESLAKQSNELLAKVQVELDKLTNTTRFKIDGTFFANDQVNFLTSINSYIFSYAKNKQIVYAIPTTDTANRQLDIPADGGDIKNITPLDEKSVLTYTSSKQIYKNTDAQNSWEKINPSGSEWAQGNQLTTYLSNIYILDSANGQIYKHSLGTNGSYEKATTYLNPTEVNIKDAISFSIDGAVYVLGKTGGVIKLIKGKSQDFNIKGIPSPNDKISEPKKIYTNEELNSLYILDGNRLLELDKTGKFVKQYVVDDLTHLSDFSLDSKTKKIWFIDSGNVYQFNF